ncbi:MAG: universal stress protein [Chloroflexi bacterium]|nr:universal stress protein [Chloroflexota bacterium]
MYRTILVPLDGSRLGEGSLALAQILAQATGARLVLVRAAWAQTMPGIDSGEAQLHALSEAQTYLGNAAAHLAEHGLAIETAVPYAPAPDGILVEAGLRRADLIVMSTHGRSGLGRWVYGSVAEAVLRKSPVPVLLVQPTATVETLLTRELRPALLVPLDGSRFAEAALPHAIALARALGGRIVLVRVHVPPRAVPELALVAPGVDEEADQQGRLAAETYLAEVVERLRRERLRPQAVLQTGPAAEGILEGARAARAGVIVMATHGRTGLERLLFGSVATEVLHRSVLPLLLVRPAAVESARVAPHG